MTAIRTTSQAEWSAANAAPGIHARLDSAASDSPWSRWSYVPGPARLRLRCNSQTLVTTLSEGETVVESWRDPLSAIAWLQTQTDLPPGDGPPYKGGWLGWMSYDLGRLFENLPALAADPLGLPLFDFTWHDQVWAHDGWDARHYDISLTGRSPAPAAVPEGRTFAPSVAGVVSNFSRRAYEEAVAEAIEYIAAGDVFQVNLSQRFTAGLPAAPRTIYDRLRTESPAWFGAYFNGGDYALLCNSPELFLRVTPSGGGRRILTRPVKGTRPRGAGLGDELAGSAKDAAELNMIIDLERNDLGRVCRTGSVRVTEPRAIERHPTVFHGAATIEGVLRDDVGLVELLRAVFPGGSVTGAPKVRAMQIIESLEPVRRGPYCGAIGYLSADGHIQFNVAIRTMIVRGREVHIPVGGGIVADSVPAAEYEETLVKARAMFASLGVAPRV